MSTGLRFTLEVDGLPPDAFAVVSFHLNQSLSSLFSLDLSLVSQQFLSLEFQQILDKMAYLTIWQGDDVQRRVKGVVTWFELGENDKNQMLYSMKVCPPLWRTGLRQNFRIFQNEDIESILGTILQENGVTEWSPLFSEPHPSREFCVQYGETDYDFLCRMAAEEGIFFYEEHAQKSTDQSLVLCDTVRYLPESFEIPWNPNTRTEVSTLCISQFRYSAQIRPSSVVTKDYTFKRPGWAGRFDQEGQYQDYQRTQYEVYDYPGRFKGAHGQNFARWQMDGWRNNAETARGMSRSPEIWPGRRIVLTGHPQANLLGPLPFILSRAYSSYRTRTPAPVGVFGPGWKAPFDIRLQIRDEGLILNDNGGRSIHFEPLFPGEISYSRSESLWLARGGVAEQHSSQPLSALWQVLPEDVRLSPHVYLATNSLQGPWWILSWPERVPGADEVLPPEPPAYRVLTGVVDGFGRTLTFHRAAEGDVAGAVRRCAASAAWQAVMPHTN